MIANAVVEVNSKIAREIMANVIKETAFMRTSEDYLTSSMLSKKTVTCRPTMNVMWALDDSMILNYDNDNGWLTLEYPRGNAYARNKGRITKS